MSVNGWIFYLITLHKYELWHIGTLKELPNPLNIHAHTNTHSTRDHRQNNLPCPSLVYWKVPVLIFRWVERGISIISRWWPPAEQFWGAFRATRTQAYGWPVQCVIYIKINVCPNISASLNILVFRSFVGMRIRNRRTPRAHKAVCVCTFYINIYRDLQILTTSPTNGS